MKILIIYDTFFGNTEQIARVVGDAFRLPEEVTIIQADKAGIDHLTDIKVLIAASPTRQFNATKNIRNFLKKIPATELRGIQAAAFDTRMAVSDIKSPVFRFILNLGGYASVRLARILEKKGVRLIVPPEGFFVKGAEGPLKEGEKERAAAWAVSISKSLENQ